MGNKNGKPPPAKKGRWVQLLLLAAIVLGAVALVVFVPASGDRDGGTRSFQVVGGETKPVLDPARFADLRVQLAYQAAAKYSQVLDEVFCYCYCDRHPFNHKSLLSCFTDGHGAG